MRWCMRCGACEVVHVYMCSASSPYLMTLSPASNKHSSSELANTCHTHRSLLLPLAPASLTLHSPSSLLLLGFAAKALLERIGSAPRAAALAASGLAAYMQSGASSTPPLPCCTPQCCQSTGAVRHTPMQSCSNQEHSTSSLAAS